MSRYMPEVVIVDDDPNCADAILTLLRDQGYLADAYRTAESYLNYPGNPVTPKCMFLRVELPGMGGFELREELASRGIEVPTVFVTDYTTVETARRVKGIETAVLWETACDDSYLLEVVQEAVGY